MQSRDAQTRTGMFFLKRYKCTRLGDAVETAAHKEREVLLPGCEDYCGIPVDVEKIAQRRGLKHGECLDESDSRSAVIVPHQNSYVVKLSRTETIGGKRFSLAHEIGHDLFRQGMKHKVGILSRKEKKAEDHICEMFASALLMPVPHVQRLLSHIPNGTPWEIFRALENSARQFKVSIPALIVRIGRIRSRPKFSFALLSMKYSPNRYSGLAPRLRVDTYSSLGALRNTFIWSNCSAESVNLQSPQNLFDSWASSLDDRLESTGGRYTLNGAEKFIRADAESIRWIPETVIVDIRENGRWYKERIVVQVANCLYASKGWTSDKAYVVSVLRIETR